VLYVARDGKTQGTIGVANADRPGAAAALARLRHKGVSAIHPIRGDAKSVAGPIAQALGRDGYGAELPPEAKADYVAALAPCRPTGLLVLGYSPT